MEPMIQVKCIKHVYPDKTEVSLCGLDFVVHSGERVVVLGPNGAGKTTLLSHILGLLTPVEGTVEVMGLRPDKNFSAIRRKIGVVFQNVDEQIIGPTVYDDIAFTPRNDRIPEEEVDRRVRSVAKTLGIEGILDKIPHYLSGGQKKKVAMAGAIVNFPELLIMDEPFDGLDPKSKLEMIDLLNHLSRDRKMTLITTTHDINVVPSIADIIYVIHDGNIVARGTPGEIFSRVDLLKKANMEPPILVELFMRLREKGFLLEFPHNIDEAEEQLLRLLDKKTQHAPV